MDFLLAPGLRVFSMIAGIIIVMLIFELALVVIGLSSDLGLEGPETDATDAVFDMDTLAEIEAGIGHDLGLADHEIAMLDIDPAREPVLPLSGTRRVLDLIGVTRGPLLIWIASVAAGVSCLGFATQIILANLFGAPLPSGVALAIVAVPGVLVGGAITRWVSRLVPSVENYAAPEYAYRGQTGRLVEGAAMTGRRALVRWTDRHGTMHQLMAEPLREGDVIARGANVLILRDRERNPRLIEI